MAHPEADITKQRLVAIFGGSGQMTPARGNRNAGGDDIRNVQVRESTPSGIGKASMRALDEEPTPDRKPAQKRFMSWTEKQNPRTKNRTPRHSECDSGQPQQGKTGKTVLKIVTQ